MPRISAKNRGQGHARVFTGSQEQDVPRLISVVNLCEVLVAPAADGRLRRAAREAVAAPPRRSGSPAPE